MKKCYICSPFRADKNVQDYYIWVAKELSKKAAIAGYAVFCPHLAFQFLDDNVPEQREQAITMGKEWLKKCDIIMQLDCALSQGMIGEIMLAKSLNKRFWIIKESDL